MRERFRTQQKSRMIQSCQTGGVKFNADSGRGQPDMKRVVVTAENHTGRCNNGDRGEKTEEEREDTREVK